MGRVVQTPAASTGPSAWQAPAPVVCVHYEVGRVAVVFRPLWWQVSFRFVPGVSGRFVAKNPATSSHTAQPARTAPTSSIGSHQRKCDVFERRALDGARIVSPSTALTNDSGDLH